jgi:hypothetical protein
MNGSARWRKSTYPPVASRPIARDVGRKNSWLSSWASRLYAPETDGSRMARAARTGASPATAPPILSNPPAIFRLVGPPWPKVTNGSIPGRPNPNSEASGSPVLTPACSNASGSMVAPFGTVSDTRCPACNVCFNPDSATSKPFSLEAKPRGRAPAFFASDPAFVTGPMPR